MPSPAADPPGRSNPPDPGASVEPAVPRVRVTSETLMQGAREIDIEHAGAVYRLRVTALGRLILTK